MCIPRKGGASTRFFFLRMTTYEVLQRLLQLERLRSFGDFEDIHHAFVRVWGKPVGESLYNDFRRARGVVAWYSQLDHSFQEQVLEHAAFRF
jgi:hypothetical protein